MSETGFDAMGKPISDERRQHAYTTAREIGLNQSDAWGLVGRMSDHLERDQPALAMKAGKEHVDLTGVYRLMAALLA